MNSMGGGEGGGEGGGDPLWRKREAGQDVGMVKMRCGEECGSVSHAARPFRDCDGRGGDIGRDGSGRGAVNASVAPSASEDSSVTAGSCPSAVKPGSAEEGTVERLHTAIEPLSDGRDAQLGRQFHHL